MILAWCDDFYDRNGRWPTQDDGPVPAAIGESWRAVDAALGNGSRGLPGGSSVARLLADRRGKRNKKALPRLTEEVIAAFADVHFWWTDHWPTTTPGLVIGSPVPGETWERIDHALVSGLRGLPGGSSVARLLAGRRGVRNRKALPRLSERVIVAWADSHAAKAGVYPGENSGAVGEAPGETWYNISAALREGLRGLPGGSSLFKLLVKHGRMARPKSGR